MNKNIEKFSYGAITVIIRDILELDIIIPRLVFDYSINPNINNGYYMYQNVSGNIITLNMNSIMSLRNENDIKTVITYGFIHEIMHMHQSISSKYKTDKEFYTFIEDSADAMTITCIRENMELINKRLNFEFNDVFLMGIERQLKYQLFDGIDLNSHNYRAKTIAGALSSKLNVNFDYLYNSIINASTLKVVFPDKREYYIDLDYGTVDELDLLINLIYLTDFRIIHINFVEFIDGYRMSQLTFTLY